MTSRYETITGRQVDTSRLAPRERAALLTLQGLFATAPASDEFASAWTRKVLPLLSKVAAADRPGHPLYVIAQDLELRLGIAQGTVAPPDYRDYIVDRIEERFGSRYRFCQATGIPQAFLSQVLSGSKDFSVETLRRAAEALELSLALLPTRELATASRGETATLTEACASIVDELTVLKNARDHLRRVRRPGKRRAALEGDRTRFAGVLDRVAAPLRDLGDVEFGARILDALDEERGRLEQLLGGLREQLARVAESGPIAPRGRRPVERGSLSRV